MSSGSDSLLRQVDFSALDDIVRRSLHRPAFRVQNWAVQPMAHEKVIDTTGGVFIVSGDGQDSYGYESWSLVLKVVKKPMSWVQEPTCFAYWKREVLAFQSRILETLPPGLAAPVCFGAFDHSEIGWIWMEHIVETAGGRWTPKDFRRVAYEAGRFAGAFLVGARVPAEPWLSAPFFRSLLADNGPWASRIDAAASSNVWDHSIVRRTFGDALQSCIIQLWEERHLFWQVLERLPQVLCHNDLHRRNLMWRKGRDGEQRLTAVDWAFCGTGALGTDVGGLVITSAYFFEIEPSDVHDMEAAALEGYEAGFRDVGWTGDSQAARLGYLLSGIMGMGVTLPGWAYVISCERSKLNVERLFGRPRQAVLEGWRELTELLLNRVPEAKCLIRDLGLA